MSKKKSFGIYEKLKTLQELKNNSKDPLKILIRCTFDLMYFPPVRLVIILVFCEYAFGTMLTLHRLLDKFDTQTLFTHASFCGIQIFMLINFGSIIFMSGSFHDFMTVYRASFLPLELLDDSTKKKMIFLCKIMKLICCANIICATLAGLGFVKAPAYFDRKSCFSLWVNEVIPQYAFLMLPILHWSCLIVALIMAGSSIAWTYVGTHTIFQICIIRQIVKDVMESQLPSNLRRENQVWQVVVKQRMITSLMAYEVQVRFSHIANALLEPPILMFSLGSVILGASLMIEFLSSQEQDFGDEALAIYIGTFFFSVAGIISANLYILLGQAFKDETEKINYILSQFRWYEMSLENQKIYLIFLSRTAKPLGITCSLVQVDYFLLVRICKSLFSLVAVLAQFVSSNGAVDKQ